jgi:excisionase family DNA binding protein
MAEQKFLNIDGAAAYTHLSKATIYKKVSKKEIPFIKIGTRTLFDIEQIDQWIRCGGVMEEELPQFVNFLS